MPILQDIEPMLPSEDSLAKSDLPDKCITLISKAAELKGKLSPVTAQVLEEYMVVINSYYSNMIEGNSTHPHDIRKAQQGDYHADPAKRDLQLESLAHIKAQQAIDGFGLDSKKLLSEEFVSFLHKTFYEEVPESLLTVTSKDGARSIKIKPGNLRKQDEYVIVGTHIPPEGNELNKYMARFYEAYDLTYKNGYQPLIAAMCSHHRLLWIHPFVDGNGRTARLHTDTFLREINIGATGVWCLSRGLAKNQAKYKSSLAGADQRNVGSRDGRGGLSESKLIAFVEFMLDTAIDQVNYMDGLLQLGGMSERIKAYVRARNDGLILGMGRLRLEASRLLDQAFRLGEIPRSQTSEISGLSVSVTRKLVGQLKKEGLLTETSTRSPLRFGIPEHAESYYFPQLTPIKNGK